MPIESIFVNESRKFAYLEAPLATDGYTRPFAYMQTFRDVYSCEMYVCRRSSGLTIFKGIQAFDRDKPNTPNSDVQYSIVQGNEKGKFALESSHRAALAVKKPLDYDAGDKSFTLTIMASVS